MCNVLDSDCDIVEIRLDKFIPTKINLYNCSQPILFTARTFNEGGFNKLLTLDEELSLLYRFISFASYIDIEYRYIEDINVKVLIDYAHIFGISVICSFHYFDGIPNLNELKKISDNAFNKGADIVKFVYRTDSDNNGLNIAKKIVEYNNKPTIVMSTDEKLRNAFTMSYALYGEISGGLRILPSLEDIKKESQF